MELAIYNSTGTATSKKATLSADVFGIEPNDHAIYLDVKQYLANQRQGTHKAKERNEVAGSTRKIKRQKGTGGARAGSMKNPLFVGGGRIFGPRPRDYSFKLNKKVKQLARFSALSHKAKENMITIIDDFKISAPKTKLYSEVLKGLKLNAAKTLVVISDSDKNVYLSSRNIQKTKVVKVADLNTYDILHANTLLFSESALGIVNNFNNN